MISRQEKSAKLDGLNRQSFVEASLTAEQEANGRQASSKLSTYSDGSLETTFFGESR
jgi:hypothetical protein